MDALGRPRRIACNPFSWACGYVGLLKRVKRAEALAYIGWLLFCLIVVTSFSGCATCTKVCITECPRGLDIVEAPPEIIMVPSPLPPIPEIPPMESVENWEVVLTSPLEWAKLVVEDALTARRLLYQVVGDLQALEATRPDLSGKTLEELLETPVDTPDP